MQEDLISLQLPEEYRRAGREHIFRSSQSLTWFLRQNRKELADKGALKVIAGRNHIDPAKADAVVVAVGERAALKGHVGREPA